MNNIDKDIKVVREIQEELQKDMVYTKNLVLKEKFRVQAKAISNVLSDRKIWKKMAENLANEIILADKFIEDNCCSTGIYANFSVEKVIETFRKEVENE